VTARERLQAVLRHEPPDRTPFTIYQQMLPSSAAERMLRGEGLCIVQVMPAFRVRTPNVRVTRMRYEEAGRDLERTVYATPHGDLATLEQPAGFTSWRLEHLFKGPSDYKALRFLVDDRVLEPDYGPVAEAARRYGDEGIVRCDIGLTPLQEIMTHWMGLESFGIEWAERRDEVLALYQAMVERQCEAWDLVARSPASIANYGGNEIPEAFGLGRFEHWVVPLYDGAAEVLHRHGKLLGAHLDGNNRAWAQSVARSGLDYVEAFTPSPDTDMSLSDALCAWPGKVVWANFPSSVHLAGEAAVEAVARCMIRDARPGNRFVLGITEDVPEDRREGNLAAIARAIAGEAGQDPGVSSRPVVPVPRSG
jgi:hypothetical protein